MAEQNKLKVKASATGVEVETAGAAAGRLAHALADLISPFSEGIGAAGDSIRRYRIHREEAVVAALRRASEIRELENIPPRSVSTKLLGRWIEGASSEDSSKENITDIWARILALAPEDFDAEFAAFMDVCSQIGAREAGIISKLYSAAPAGTGWSIPSGVTKQNTHNITRVFHRLSDNLSDNHLENTETINAALSTHPLMYGMILCFTAPSGSDSYSYVYPNETNVFIVVELLERLKLVEVNRQFEYANERLFIQYVQLTQFGFRFADMCIRSGHSDHDESVDDPSIGEG